MTNWPALEAELNAWEAAGRAATLWWRDDDAQAPSAPLDRLLALSADTATPLALAVIPASAEEALATQLEALPQVQILQHGYAHHSHAAAGEKKIELGDGRPLEEVLAELQAGAARLTALFKCTHLPVLVPPWNRIGERVVAQLPDLGFRGLSSYGPRRRETAAPGLLQINSHVDILRWKPTRGFLGESAALGLLIETLAGRRRAGIGDSAIDPKEATGLLTHHLAHDEAAWRFLTRLLPLLAAHPAARLLDAAALFGLAGAPRPEGSAP